MRIFLAGTTGAVGVPLARGLVAQGHVVAGMTRTAGNIERLGGLGVQPVVCDVFDTAALTAAVVAFSPQVVVHQLTDLPDDVAHLSASMAANNRMRREGTRNLLAAALAAGARRFLAQSVAWSLSGDSGAAVHEHEQAVLEAGGVVLRYGHFYGPGTYRPSGAGEPPAVHVEEAARRTVAALEHPSGVITVVDADNDQDT